MNCQGSTKAASACLSLPQNGKEKFEAVSLLQLAADNDVDGMRRAVEGGAWIDEPEAWYGRQIGKKEMALEQRTAIMIASLFGSVEVLSYILSVYELYKTDVNLANCSDGLTPLHCAAAGGSTRVADTVKLLIRHGADVNAKDAHGRRPIDVLIVPPESSHEKLTIQRMLEVGSLYESIDPSSLQDEPFGNHMNRLHDKLKISLKIVEEKDTDKLSSDCGKMEGLLSASSTDSFGSFGSSSPLFSPLFPSSPKSPGAYFERNLCDIQDNSKGYLSDTSVPDIKNSIYATDEFRMFSFKIRPCSRAYSHDWTECPFVHPGENARRRDPRRYHYSCVPCPDFRKGACRRGDACEYAHGVFECWLHPAQYRTRLCKDGTSCTRRVCFFAHTTEELRPLFVSTGSTMPSPRASSVFDSRSISPPLQPFSPSHTMIGPPYSPASKSTSTPPLSPFSSALRASSGGPWSPPTVPMLHLPGGGLHSSRLRSTLSARDIQLEDRDEIQDLDPIMASDLPPQPIQVRPTSTVLTGPVAKAGRVSKYCSLDLNLSPSNLLDLLSSEMSSSNAVPHQTSLQELDQMSPKSLCYRTQGQRDMKLNALFSPRSSKTVPNVQNRGMSHGEEEIKHFDFLSSSPRSSLATPGGKSKAPSSPAASVLPDSSLNLSDLKVSAMSKENGSLSSKDFLCSISSAAWSDWGSPSGKPDWGAVHSLEKLQKASSFAARGGLEPDLSWVQTPSVKDGPADMEKVGHNCYGGTMANRSKENVDRLFETWIEQIRQNQVAA